MCHQPGGKARQSEISLRGHGPEATMMDKNSIDLKASWKERQESLGSTKRSVLYKNFPGFLNNYVHDRHIQFILGQLPAAPDNILDLGCGYGRISTEIRNAHPASTIQGVELCDEFSEQFRKNVGECASGTIQDYQPTRKFDVILFITVLMYLTPGEIVGNLSKYWEALSPGGRFICIEPCNNMMVRLRKAANTKKLSPTGGDLVHYFGVGELSTTLSNLPNSRILNHEKFGIIPLINMPRLHDGFSIQKGNG